MRATPPTRPIVLLASVVAVGALWAVGALGPRSVDAADGANAWARATSLLPATLLRATSWLQFRGLMGNASLLISNVRGPAAPFYCFGARVESFHPYFGVQDGLGLNVVLFSYAGELQIGLGADPDLMPELGSFAEGVTKAFGELTSIL